MPESIWEDLRKQINSQINQYTSESTAAHAGA